MSATYDSEVADLLARVRVVPHETFSKMQEAHEVEGHETLPHSITLSVPFGTAREAEIASKVLAVDRDVNPAQSRRILRSNGNVLEVIYFANSIRLLRTVVSAFFDSLVLVARSFEMFA